MTSREDSFDHLKNNYNIAYGAQVKSNNKPSHMSSAVHWIQLELKFIPELIRAHLIIRNAGVCSQINSIRIINTVCQKIIAEGAIFPETNPPAPQYGAKMVIGQCIGSSTAGHFIKIRPVAWCQADGNWIEFINPCRCPRGKERKQGYCVSKSRYFILSL